MRLREETGRYLVENKDGNEDEVREFTSMLKSKLTCKTDLGDGTPPLVSTCSIPKDYELLDGTRLIRDNSKFFDPITNREFNIKSYEVINKQDVI